MATTAGGSTSASGALSADLSDRLASAGSDESTRPYDYQLKLLTLGDPGVGKTSLVLRYVKKTFSANLMNTIGVDFIVKVVKVDNVRLRLQIWDTAGQERFRSLASSYTRGADGVLVVYDITMQSTFAMAEHWLRSDLGTPRAPVVKVLVGNKCDNEAARAIPTARGQALAESVGVRFFETSALTGAGVEQIFDYLATELKRLRKVGEPAGQAGTDAGNAPGLQLDAAPAGRPDASPPCAC